MGFFAARPPRARGSWPALDQVGTAPTMAAATTCGRLLPTMSGGDRRMDFRPRAVPIGLLDPYGDDLLGDRRRLRGLLLDHCGDCCAEIHLLVQAHEA